MPGSESGLSKKAHLYMVWKQTGRMPDELGKVIPVPEEMMYLWDWLNELQYPLSFMELEAWQRSTQRKLEGWEVRVMQELDKVRSYG